MGAPATQDDAKSADFWAWSLDRYQADGVATKLLALQDNFGLNVNILLWCGWCAANFQDIPEPAMQKAVDLTADWTRAVTGALRGARRALKTPPDQAACEDVAALRDLVKNAELAAEKIEQQMLAGLAGDALESAADGSNSLARLRRNLVRYGAVAGAQHGPGFSVALLDDLARALLPGAAARDQEQA